MTSGIEKPDHVQGGDFAGSGDLAAGEADLPTRFRRHADAIERSGRSPLSVALMRGAADNIAEDGIVAELISEVPLPPGQAPALRLLAALHRLVLEGRAPELDRYYPTVGGGDPPAGIWKSAEKTMRTHGDEVRAALFRVVQTNEPGRSAVLYGVLLWVWQRYRLPVRLLEIGASAGLNLLAPDYAYRIGDSLIGNRGSPLVFEDPWIATPVADPIEAAGHLVVTMRRGCDVAPIDVTSAEGRLDLLSYIWADEPERIARMRASLLLAEQRIPIVDREDAAPWLARMLHPPQEEVNVVWQSVFAQYLTSTARSQLTSQIEAAAASLSGQDPLVWARMEPEADPMLGFAVTVKCWPSGDNTSLARAGDHGPPVHWIA